MQGTDLRKLREKKNMTLAQVSEQLNIPATTIAAYERGIRKPKIKNLVKLADFYGVSLSMLDFFDYSDDSNLKPNNRLREIRLSKDLTLKKVANEIGISENLIGKYERNEREPKLKTWIKLADYFNVSVSYLQGLTGFSKGKAPSDDLDINYLHQRLDQLKEINDLQELHKELKNIAELAHSMKINRQEDKDHD
ncbi:transcriptional regulator [Lactobacillus salivarius]|uniref:helix-turn-helix domain-containing protein n=1 Tax=Ligilactobacillus salivarius TaxID=1624 RepID=UPI001474BB11|nr:helix-turn-helix transcriptional regulator [Ligilactobacillus salivarius]NME24029.1 transcriptional regulator [Ligilactobacillus salivarius]